MENRLSDGYEAFLHDNRIKVNKYLNRVLWFFVITGPAIAAGVKGGIYHDISYTTCISISVIVVILATSHMFLQKKIPSSTVTCLFVLSALDALIVYMSCSHVSIHLTWFLVPMLSLLFCNKGIYF